MNKFMQIAIEEAKLSGKDIPVGAIIVYNGEIIAKSHNTKEIDNNITSHAEILVLNKASEIFNNWRLDNCDLYVTLEPCPMCGWAILQSRIRNIYFGSYDTKYGAFSVANLEKISDYKSKIYGGMLEQECDQLLKNYFNSLR